MPAKDYAYLLASASHLAAFGKDSVCRRHWDAFRFSFSGADSLAAAGGVSGGADAAGGSGAVWLQRSRCIFRLLNANGVSCN